MIIALLFASLFFILAYTQHRKKGFVINNRYIFASQKERLEIDWTDYYNQSRNIFMLFGIYCLSYVFIDIRKVDGIHPIQIAILVIICLYAIISGYKIVKKHGL